MVHQPREMPVASLAEVARQCREKLFAAAVGVDLILTVDPVHVGYLSGYRSLQHDVTCSFQTAAIVTPDDVGLVTSAGDFPGALEVLADHRLIFRYGRFYIESSSGSAFLGEIPPPKEDFKAALLAAVTTLAGSGQVIGLDAPDEATYRLVSAELDDFRIVDLRPILLACRAVKLDCEIEVIEGAASIVEAALGKAIACIDGTASELDLAAIIAQDIVRAGGRARSIVVAAGNRSALVDVRPSAQIIATGMIVRFDLAACFGGYWVDMARTVSVGKPAGEQARRYEALLSGQLAQLDCARAGIAASHLFEVATETIRKNGIPHYQRVHCGHGIGIMPFEAPSISPHDATILQENMVLSLETPYYELGWGGMSVEDVVVVAKDGVRLLTTSSRALKIALPA